MTGGEPGLSIGSLVLGICSLVAWLLPVVGYPVSILGLVFGIAGRHRRPGGLGTAGIICSSIGLAVTLLNSGVGAYQFLNESRPNNPSNNSAVVSTSPSPIGLTSFVVVGTQWVGTCDYNGNNCSVSATVVNTGGAGGTGIIKFYAIVYSGGSYSNSNPPTRADYYDICTKSDGEPLRSRRALESVGAELLLGALNFVKRFWLLGNPSG